MNTLQIKKRLSLLKTKKLLHDEQSFLIQSHFNKKDSRKYNVRYVSPKTIVNILKEKKIEYNKLLTYTMIDYNIDNELSFIKKANERTHKEKFLNIFKYKSFLIDGKRYQTKFISVSLNTIRKKRNIIFYNMFKLMILIKNNIKIIIS